MKTGGLVVRTKGLGNPYGRLGFHEKAGPVRPTTFAWGTKVNVSCSGGLFALG